MGNAIPKVPILGSLVKGALINPIGKLTGIDPVGDLLEPKKPPKPRTIIGAGGAPGRSNPDVQEAGSAARQRGRGRASTIIAALEGQLPAGSVRKRSLGG